MKKHLHWFRPVACMILALFTLIMVAVATVAFLRPSGSTGQDAASIQKTRVDAARKTL